MCSIAPDVPSFGALVCSLGHLTSSYGITPPMIRGSLYLRATRLLRYRLLNSGRR